MSRWLIEIDGESFDTEELPRTFLGGDFYGVKEGEKVLLTGPGFDWLENENEVHQRAHQLVQDMYAAIRLQIPTIKTPKVGIVILEDDDGRRRSWGMLSALLTSRSKVFGYLEGGSDTDYSQAKEPGGQRRFRIAESEPRLLSALRLISNETVNWTHLYTGMEELERFLGRPLNKAGYCTRLQRERFRRSANSQLVAGMDSRHAHSSHNPPDDPMEVSEAKTFMARMLAEVIDDVPS